MDYETVIKRIIQKQEDTIGMIARQRAKRIEAIDPDGEEITFTKEATKEDLEALMEEYKEIQGKGAVGIARGAVSDLLEDEDEEIDIPEEIMPK